MRVYFYTFGCKSNQYETNQLIEKFAALGFAQIDTPQDADIIVVNTCSVTHIAERKARNIIRKFITQNPSAKLYVCGCYVNIAEFSQIIPTAIPIKQEIKLEPEKWRVMNSILSASQCLAPARHPSPANAGAPLGKGSQLKEYRIREFLKIQEGCDCFCSYCIIPYARPIMSSEPPEKILAEAEKLLQHGVREIILTGINLGRYSYENKTLIDILHLLKDTPRLRLSSIEPDRVTPELLAAINSNPRIARHLHIPLQSGSDKILKAMNRKYTTDDFRKLIVAVRKPLGENIGLTTDIIVGFPGETKETFQKTYEFIQEMNFSDLHIFPYSPRPLTAAADLKQTCSDKDQKQFINKLEKLRQKLKKDFWQKQTTLNVLAENECGGFSSEYVPVKFTEKVESGKFYTAIPLEIKEDTILAQPAY